MKKRTDEKIVVEKEPEAEVVKTYDADRHERSGMGWIGWLIALLALAAIAWLVVEALDNDAEEGYTETAAVTAYEDGAEGVMITSPVAMGADETQLVGKRVDLGNMKVTSVVSDKGFFVKPADMNTNDELFVWLDEKGTPDQAVEGRYDVTPGQVVQIQGIVKDVDSRSLAALTQQEKTKAQSEPFFIHANSLDITARP